MPRKGRLIGAAQGLCARNGGRGAARGIFKTDMPGEGQGFLGGIEDLQQMATQALRRQTRQRGTGFIQGGEEIAEQHGARMARQARIGGLGRLFRQKTCQGRQRGTANKGARRPEAAYPFPAAQQQGGKGQKQCFRPFLLGGQSFPAAPGHARPAR